MTIIIGADGEEYKYGQFPTIEHYQKSMEELKKYDLEHKTNTYDSYKKEEGYNYEDTPLIVQDDGKIYIVVKSI